MQRITDSIKQIFGGKSTATPQEQQANIDDKWSRISGQWKQYHIKVKKHWSELTDAEVMEVNGRHEILAEKLQARYSITLEEANQQIDRWTNNLSL